ncbi:MAG: hydrogenase maturation protease [Bryobacteraceae bacterium]
MILASGTLVIGYGNTLRGDDGAGFYVAERLGAGAIACQQLTPELAEPIARTERVIFVDAHAGVPAGRITVQQLKPHESAAMHRFDPETLLAWSQQLYGRAPEAILIGIGGESFELGQGLSPAARQAMREAVRAIRRVARAWRTSLAQLTKS